MRQLLSSLLLILSINFLQAQNSVGIGTTTPSASAQLDIVSPSNNKGLLIPRMTSAQRIAISSPANGLLVYETTTNSFWYYNNTSLSWIQFGTGGGSASWTTSGNSIYNSNTGNVGIGTIANINEKLTVKGDVLFTYPSDANSVTLSLMGNTNNQARINFIKPDSSVLGSIYSWDLNDNLYLQQGSNANQLVLNDNGFVGIRTSIPTKALDVFGSIRSRDTITADNDLVAGSDIRAGGSITGAGLTSNGTLYVTGSSLQEGNITAIGSITCLSTGNFTGDINSNTSMTITDAAGILTFRTGGNDKGFVQLSGDNLRVGTFSGNTTGKFVIRTGGYDQVSVEADGNMNLVNGPGAGLTSNGHLMLGSQTSTNVIIDDNEIMARNNGTGGSLILQRSGGSVRIGGTAVPAGYLLGISGKVICEELKVKLASSGWPDYVFANDYKLKSLPQLEKYIEQNKHLPNIPSAIEVEKNGIEVGDMQKKMMEKIEELTLYVIELQKQLDLLKANK